MHLDLLKPSGSNSAPPSCKIAVTPAKESSKRSTLPSALADTNRMSSPQISLSGTKTLPNANSLSAVAIHSHLDGKINDSSLSFTGLETDSNLNAKVKSSDQASG